MFSTSHLYLLSGFYHPLIVFYPQPIQGLKSPLHLKTEGKSKQYQPPLTQKLTSSLSLYLFS